MDPPYYTKIIIYHETIQISRTSDSIHWFSRDFIPKTLNPAPPAPDLLDIFEYEFTEWWKFTVIFERFCARCIIIAYLSCVYDPFTIELYG